MPLIIYESFNQDYIWGLWKIEESERFLRNEVMNSEDFNELQLISSSKKRIQTLAGRLLLKQLVQKFSMQYSGLVKDVAGKPYSKDGKFNVSISHTHDVCVGIVHPQKKVGIDIESVRNQLNSVAPKFLNTFELSIYSSDINQLCICWCVKEVIYKINGMKNISLKDHISITDFDIRYKEGIVKAELNAPGFCESFKIKYFKYNNYYIAYNFYDDSI